MRLSSVLAVGRQNAFLGRNAGYCGPCDRAPSMPSTSCQRQTPNILRGLILAKDPQTGAIRLQNAREYYRRLPNALLCGQLYKNGKRLSPKEVVKATNRRKYPIVITTRFADH